MESKDYIVLFILGSGLLFSYFYCYNVGYYRGYRQAYRDLYSALAAKVYDIYTEGAEDGRQSCLSTNGSPSY